MISVGIVLTLDCNGLIPCLFNHLHNKNRAYVTCYDDISNIKLILSQITK